jgi:hypothetical protein
VIRNRLGRRSYGHRKRIGKRHIQDFVEGAGFERFDALVSIPQSASGSRGLCSWGQVLVVAWSSGRQAVSTMSSILVKGQ